MSDAGNWMETRRPCIHLELRTVALSAKASVNLQELQEYTHSARGAHMAIMPPHGAFLDAFEAGATSGKAIQGLHSAPSLYLAFMKGCKTRPHALVQQRVPETS